KLATTRRPATVPPVPLPRITGSAGSIDGCGGRPARIWVSTNVTLANSASITTSPGPAPGSATSAASRTSGGPNSRITTARTTAPPHRSAPHRSDSVRLPASDRNVLLPLKVGWPGDVPLPAPALGARPAGRGQAQRPGRAGGAAGRVQRP